MIQVGLSYGWSQEETRQIEAILHEILEELVAGDIKYGPHPGPNRAKGTLLNEMRELFTEIDAENATPLTVRGEMKQVAAMVIKAMRDGNPKGKEQRCENK